MATPYKINLTLFIIFMACFILVLNAGINKDLFITINSFAAHICPFIWANLTFMGDTMAACAILILFIRKRPDLVWSGIIAAIIGTLIVNMLKIYFNAPRPPAIIDKNIINIIGPALIGRSFPSGHTVTIFTLAGILMFFFRSLFVKLGLILIALLTGISRIAVGVHWPADVLAGAAIGCLCATIGVYSVTKLGWNRNRPLQIITGSVLVLSNFYLLVFYDCKYEQAIYLQYSLAFITLVAGIREYYLLIRNHRNLY
jgi:membrane-associated phospholipid phosphatase